MSGALNIANEEYELEITPQVPGGQIVAKSLTDIAEPMKSSKVVTAGNKAILHSKIQWSQFKGCTLSGYKQVEPGGASLVPIQATAVKCKVDAGKAVLRESDQGTCQCSFMQTTGSATVTASCIVKIQKAGQDKVKGE